MAEIIPLDRVSAAAVEDLLDHAFGTDRTSRTAYRMRAGTRALAALSFAALDERGALAGTVQCWPVKLVRESEMGAEQGIEIEAAASDPLVMVGPVAVEPALQRGGVGRMLMRAAIAAADARRSPPLMMIGDPEYYGRFFGFVAEGTGAWEIDGPVERHRLLARARSDQRVPLLGRVVPDLGR